MAAGGDGGDDIPPIPVGAEVYGADGGKVGTVVDVGREYFLVASGWFAINDRYLPIRTVALVDEGRVLLTITKDQAASLSFGTPR